MDTTEIIKSTIQLLAQLGLFGIAAYYIQKQIDSASQKRLEEFRHTLSLMSTKGIKLHEKRLLVIEDLYGKLVELETAMLWLTSPLKFVFGNPAEYENGLLKNAAESYSAFAVFFEKNKIYFTTVLCLDIEKIRNTFNEAMINYNEHKLFEKDEVDRKTYIAARQKMLDAFKTVKEIIPKLRHSLESDFRKILAVE